MIKRDPAITSVLIISLLVGKKKTKGKKMKDLDKKMLNNNQTDRSEKYMCDIKVKNRPGGDVCDAQTQ